MANEARKLQRRQGYPRAQEIIDGIKHGAFRNVPVTITDFNNAEVM